MERYKLFGDDSRLSYVAKLIMQEDIDRLDKCINIKWKVNDVFEVCKFIVVLPITLALIENKTAVVDYLLSKKVNLNKKGEPAIVSAVRNCDEHTIKKLVHAGAKLNIKDNVGKNAISAALYSNRYELLPLLLELGLQLDSDGGKSFRQAVSNKQCQAVKFFIEHGFDPNLRVPDMVFPYNTTAVGVAARNNDFEMVKYLVSNGADVSLSDDYGARPYLDAVRNKNDEMAEFLKNLEPKEWHDKNYKVAFLIENGVPPDLISFLDQPSPRIDMSNEYIRFIEFQNLENVKYVKWKRREFLDLLSNADKYPEDGFLVWLKKERKLGSADYEHERLIKLCGWSEFLANPDKWIRKIFK